MSDRKHKHPAVPTRRQFLVASGAAMLAGGSAEPQKSTAQGASEKPAATSPGSQTHVLIPETKVEILAETDVLVCGGGPAGVAAACSAARHGAKTVLIERWPFLGGMGTAALVNIWHLSDREKIVIRGIAEEATERAEQRGWIRFRGSLKKHETHDFDPEGMKVVFHDMLESSGVRVICHLTAGEPILQDGRIRGVLVDTKRGRRAILARTVIDATGDGDVAAKAGVAFDYGRQSDGLVQGMTMCLNTQVPNLAVAGRCASSTHEAHSSVRLQSHALVMGQGVGTAAAMALQGGQEMHEVDVRMLQDKLRSDGAYIEDVPQA
jgi:NADPH-dependent 2,4-dienoyl-CoA reductase/sulfur reductase-like enzyme